MFAHSYLDPDSERSIIVDDDVLIRTYTTEAETDVFAGRITWGALIAEVYSSIAKGRPLIGGAFLPFEQKQRFGVVDVCWHAEIGLALLFREIGGGLRLLVNRPLRRSKGAYNTDREHEKRLDETELLLEVEGQWAQVSFDEDSRVCVAGEGGRDHQYFDLDTLVQR